MGKIFKDEESTPENMKVLFSKNSSKYLFPCQSNSPTQELKNRRERLRAEEKLFVEGFGLRYVE